MQSNTGGNNKENSNAIGQTLVDLEFPPPSISPVFFKPITWLVISLLVFGYSLGELVKERLASSIPPIRLTLLAICLLATILSAYWMIYSFMIWGALLIKADGASFNPDTITSDFMYGQYKINMVFATKLSTTILACCIYWAYILHQQDKRSDQGSKILHP